MKVFLKILALVLVVLAAVLLCAGRFSPESDSGAAVFLRRVFPTPTPTPVPTVLFPDGQSVTVEAETLDLSAVRPEDGETALALLGELPQLKTLELGDEKGPFSPEQVLALGERRPDLKLGYTLEVNGAPCELDAQRLDLRELRAADVAALLPKLTALRALRSVELGEPREDGPDWAQIAALRAAAPNAAFNYAFELYGVPLTLESTEIDINHIPVDDAGAHVREVIACMPRLKTLIMDSCGVSNEDMAAIRDDFPNVEVVWRIWFGWTYSVRTNVEKILASKTSWGGEMTGRDVEVLKYCTKVRFLDIGHNENIDDISFVRCMPDLEVCIVAMNSLRDISPLADCPKLEYLELFYTYVEDLSPLAGLKNLRHLNVSTCWFLKDISPVYDLDLERFYIGALTPIPTEQVEEYRRRHPDCEVNDELYEGSWGTWRFADEASTELVPRYALLREQFNYDDLDYSVYWLDPNY